MRLRVPARPTPVTGPHETTRVMGNLPDRPDVMTMDAVMHGWVRKNPGVARVTRMWTDPCPVCGAAVGEVHAETQYVTVNDDEIIGYRNLSCRWDPDDPDSDSEDCICGPAIVNPYPDPSGSSRVPVHTVFTLKPCGHTTPRIKVYTQEKAEPGTLGALYEDVARRASGDV